MMTWTSIRGVSADGAVEWEEKFWVGPGGCCSPHHVIHRTLNPGFSGPVIVTSSGAHLTVRPTDHIIEALRLRQTSTH